MSEDLILEKFMPYRLARLSSTVSTTIARAYDREFGLSIPEWRVMAVLAQHEGLSADEVCLNTEMDKVTVSRAVTKLLSKKFIDRNFSDQDRRRSILQLSRSGYTIYAQIVPLAAAAEPCVYVVR